MKNMFLVLSIITFLSFTLSCQTVPKQTTEIITPQEYPNLPPQAQKALDWFRENPKLVKQALEKGRIIYDLSGIDGAVYSKTFGKNDRIRLPDIPGIRSIDPIYSYNYEKLYLKIIDPEPRKDTIISLSPYEKPRVLYCGDYFNIFDVAPDESELAFYRKEDPWFQVYRYDLKAKIQTQFSDPSVGGLFCSYSPDGQFIAYCANRKLRIKNIHTGQESMLVADNTVKEFPRWSHDGKWIVYQGSFSNGESYDIYKIEVANARVYQLTDNPGLDANPCFDATDEHIVYMSSPEKEQRIQTLWVMDADGNNKHPDPTSDTNVYYPNF